METTNEALRTKLAIQVSDLCQRYYGSMFDELQHELCSWKILSTEELEAMDKWVNGKPNAPWLQPIREETKTKKGFFSRLFSGE